MTGAWEQHSADGLDYIDRTVEGWGVWWRGNLTAPTYATRQAARVAIRAMKGHIMTEHYIMGWNDRVAKTSEDYGKTYLSSGGEYVANAAAAEAWAPEHRAQYVLGWEEASAKIASLKIG